MTASLGTHRGSIATPSHPLMNALSRGERR
jgi:hypothetical protein